MERGAAVTAIRVARDVIHDWRWAVTITAPTAQLDLVVSGAELRGLHQAVAELGEHTLSSVSLTGEDDMTPDAVEVIVSGTPDGAALSACTSSSSALAVTFQLDADDVHDLTHKLGEAVAHADDDDEESQP